MHAKNDEATFFFFLPLSSQSQASSLFLSLHPLSFHSLRCHPLWPWLRLHISSTPLLQRAHSTNTLLLHTRWVKLLFLLSFCSWIQYCSLSPLNILVTLLVDVRSPPTEENKTVLTKTKREEEEQECDVFSGRWVRDELTRPLYEESECPYIQPQLTCQEHGRPEKEYQRWRWQPHGCNLPT